MGGDETAVSVHPGRKVRTAGPLDLDVQQHPLLTPRLQRDVDKVVHEGGRMVNVPLGGLEDIPELRLQKTGLPVEPCCRVQFGQSQTQKGLEKSF